VKIRVLHSTTTYFFKFLNINDRRLDRNIDIDLHAFINCVYLFPSNYSIFYRIPILYYRIIFIKIKFILDKKTKFYTLISKARIKYEILILNYIKHAFSHSHNRSMH
jgi:hypothetical protein